MMVTYVLKFLLEYCKLTSQKKQFKKTVKVVQFLSSYSWVVDPKIFQSFIGKFILRL